MRIKCIGGIVKAQLAYRRAGLISCVSPEQRSISARLKVEEGDS